MEPILIGKIVGTAAYMVLEYWLGKTDKVKSGSVLEAALAPFKFLWATKKEEPKS